MSFDKLIVKVRQAEDTLEARERQVSANVRQLKQSWKTVWTPGHIVVAGLAGGFLTGRMSPASRAGATGVSVLRILSTLSGLMATSTAREAAGQAEQAADSAEDAVDAVESTGSVAGSMDL